MINVPIITILARNITKAPKFVWTLNIAQKTKMFENVNKYFFLALFFLKRDFKISLKTQFELLLNRKLDFKQDFKSLKNHTLIVTSVKVRTNTFKNITSVQTKTKKSSSKVHVKLCMY